MITLLILIIIYIIIGILSVIYIGNTDEEIKSLEKLNSESIMGIFIMIFAWLILFPLYLKERGVFGFEINNAASHPQGSEKA